MVFVEVVKDDLKQQLPVDNFKNFTEALCTNKQLIIQLVICHHKCSSQLYVDCKKKPDPMLSFQLCWHKQCSSFLLVLIRQYQHLVSARKYTKIDVNTLRAHIYQAIGQLDTLSFIDIIIQSPAVPHD